MVTLLFIIIIIIFRCWLCLQLQCWQTDSIRTAKADHLAPNLIILLRTQSGILQGPETNWLFLPRQLILPYLFRSEAQLLFYWTSTTCFGCFWVATGQRPSKVSGFVLAEGTTHRYPCGFGGWASLCSLCVKDKQGLSFPFWHSLFFVTKGVVEEGKCLTSQHMSFLCG